MTVNQIKLSEVKELPDTIRQINDYTDITFSYEQHKIGKAVTDFTFKHKPQVKIVGAGTAHDNGGIKSSGWEVTFLKPVFYLKVFA